MTSRFTQPELLDHSAELIGRARQLSPDQIASLMKISDKLAGLNAARFAQWQPGFQPGQRPPGLAGVQGRLRGWRWTTSRRGSRLRPGAPAHALPGLYGVCARSI